MTDSEQEHDGAGRRGTAVDTAVNAAAGDADIAMTVGEVSTLLGVSVRALHHWDETGLRIHPDAVPPATGSTARQTSCASSRSSSTGRPA